MKKILIIHSKGGMGHVVAARALEEALSAKFSEIEIKNIDILEFAPKIYKKFYVDGYNYISSNTPFIWGLLYKFFDKKTQVTLPEILSKMALESKFISYLEEYKPDFIIATHPLPIKVISLSREKEGKIEKIPSSLVITDYGIHSYWVDKGVDYYFVGSQEVKDLLENYGIPTEKTMISGIPIRLEFMKKIYREKSLRAHGLDPSKPIFLMVGGQFKFQELLKIIRGIKAKKPEIQFIIIAGRDKELHEKLKSSEILKGKESIKIFGFVENIEDFMGVADLIFTKAGGLTVSECLAMNLPMVIYKVIPGQEEPNVEYLVKNGAGIKEKSIKGIIKGSLEIFDHPETLLNMKKACQKLGKPDAAIKIAEFIYSKIQN